MAFTQDPATETPAVRVATEFAQTTVCDPDLQSLLEAVNTLMQTVAATGQGNMRDVTLEFSLVRAAKDNLQFIATWKGR